MAIAIYMHTHEKAKPLSMALAWPIRGLERSHGVCSDPTLAEAIAASLERSKRALRTTLATDQNLRAWQCERELDAYQDNL